jgi:hypothetical protein
MIEAFLPVVTVLCLTTTKAQAQPTIKIHIQVIEASTTSKDFDPKLKKLKKAFRGYKGAKIVDQLEAKVTKGSSLSLEILRKSRLLSVTFKDLKPDGSIRLKVSIAAFKFSAETTHKKKNATVVVAHETSETSAIFLAVTPRLE